LDDEESPDSSVRREKSSRGRYGFSTFSSSFSSFSGNPKIGNISG
jgi:hypothetical protein